MINLLISNDSKYRAVVETDKGLVAFPHAPGGKIDGNNPEMIPGLHVLDDTAGISYRSHMTDPTLERLATSFTQTLTL